MSDAFALRFRGKLSDLSSHERQMLFDRSSSPDKEVAAITAAIIERVRDEGDDALFGFAREFDGVEMYSLEVPRDVIRAAFDSFDHAERRARTSRMVTKSAAARGRARRDRRSPT